MIHTRTGITWIGPEEDAGPYGGIHTGHRKGCVRMPNGQVQMVKLGIPDTFFTIPAYSRTLGRGFVTADKEGEFCFHAKRTS